MQSILHPRDRQENFCVLAYQESCSCCFACWPLKIFESASLHYLQKVNYTSRMPQTSLFRRNNPNTTERMGQTILCRVFTLNMPITKSYWCVVFKVSSCDGGLILPLRILGDELYSPLKSVHNKYT